MEQNTSLFFLKYQKISLVWCTLHPPSFIPPFYSPLFFPCLLPVVVPYLPPQLTTSETQLRDHQVKLSQSLARIDDLLSQSASTHQELTRKDELIQKVRIHTPLTHPNQPKAN